MQQEIINHLENPGQLEKLYRDNKTTFKREFNLIYRDIRDNAIAQVWYERLNYEQEEISWGTRKDLTFIIIASLIAGLLAKIPEITGIDEEFFYRRNIAFIVFPLLTAYFGWKQKMKTRKIFFLSAAVLVSVVYINMLPINNDSHTLILACIHLPFVLWAITGSAFVGEHMNKPEKRIDFLRYNGDLVVMTTIIVIAGGLLTAVTLGLFDLIDLNIEKIYMEYIVVFGAAASPIVGTYLVRANPHLVNKVSPVIARVFTPIVLATLLIYLVAVIITGKDPYNDREFLIVFNALLIGVMAIILFSITAIPKNSVNKTGALLLIGLSIVTVIVNGIALSAILFRIAEYGITPNRLAVLGSNSLILTNLLMVTFRLLRTLKDSNETEKVGEAIVSFLPAYILWSVTVTFVFPLLFNFQ